MNLEWAWTKLQLNLNDFLLRAISQIMFIKNQNTESNGYTNGERNLGRANTLIVVHVRQQTNKIKTALLTFTSNGLSISPKPVIINKYVYKTNGHILHNYIYEFPSM